MRLQRLVPIHAPARGATPILQRVGIPYPRPDILYGMISFPSSTAGCPRTSEAEVPNTLEPERRRCATGHHRSPAYVPPLFRTPPYVRESCTVRVALAPRWARLFGDRKYVVLKVGKVPLPAHDDVIKDRYAENVAGVHEALRHSVVFERRRRRAV